jgi:hypothetical protein
MSKILRRPLFRGGPVSSYGTGIASGLADGGRVGLYRGYRGTVGQAQKNMTGGDIVENVNRYSYFDPNALPGFRNVKRAMPIVDVNAGQDGGQQLGDTDYLVEKGYISDVEKPVEKMSMEELIDYQIGEKGDVYQTGKSGLTKTVTGIDKNGNFITTTEDGTPRQVTSVEDLTEDEKLIYRTKQKDSAQGAASMESTLPGVIKVETNPEEVNPNTAQVINEGEESTTINEDDIREQAALFDKLLNEDYEKDKRSAQISDASDYALQFFKSTIGEGKGIKEAAGDVAGRALATPSRTEKVQEGKKKTKQTATVMAINEAIAQGKSERDINMLIAKSGLDLENKKALVDYGQTLTKGFSALAGHVADSKSIGFLARLKDGLSKSGLIGYPTVETTSTDMADETKFKFDKNKDTGRIFIETDTETAYVFDENGKKTRVA